MVSIAAQLAAVLGSACLLFGGLQVQGAYTFTNADVDALAAQAVEVDNRTLVYGQEDPNFANSTGYVRTFVELFDGEDLYSGPKAIGIELQLNVTDPSLLPDADMIFNMTGGKRCGVVGTKGEKSCAPPGLESWITFPGANTSFVPFDAMQFVREPLGHEPAGIYDIPHFDLHFYMVPEAYIKANVLPGPCGLSTVDPVTWNLGNQPFPEECFAQPMWRNLGSVVPFMGNHLLNTQAKEYNFTGAPRGFDETFILGVFNSSFIFYEVMTSDNFFSTLSAGDKVCRDLMGTPTNFATSGFRPSAYCYEQTEEVLRVEFTEFEWHDASPICATSKNLAEGSFQANPKGVDVEFLPMCKTPSKAVA